MHRPSQVQKVSFFPLLGFLWPQHWDQRLANALSFTSLADSCDKDSMKCSENWDAEYVVPSYGRIPTEGDKAYDTVLYSDNSRYIQ